MFNKGQGKKFAYVKESLYMKTTSSASTLMQTGNFAITAFRKGLEPIEDPNAARDLDEFKNVIRKGG